MKNKTKWIFATLSILALSLILVGCGSDNSKKAEDKKVLHIGTHATYPPFEFTKANSEEIQGFDYDLMEAIAKRIGYTISWKNMSFDGIVPALQSGQLDGAIAAMNITPARSKVVDFSDAYYETSSVVVHLKGNDITTVAALENKNIGVQIGTAEADMAKKIAGAKVKEFNNIPDALNDMKIEGVDAVLVDKPIALYYSKQDSDKFEIFQFDDKSAPLGIAISKKQGELVPKINKALADMKADGEYQKIVDKWFK